MSEQPLTEMIIGGRGMGKTHKLLKELLVDDRGLMVCGTEQMADYQRSKFEKMLNDYGIVGEEARLRAARQITGPPSKVVGLRGHKRHVYIDNLVEVLAALLGVGPHEIKVIADNLLVSTPQGKRFEYMEDNLHLGDIHV